MILLVMIFILGMLLFHTYFITTDKSTESGAGELLSGAVLCFKSSLVSLITVLLLFFYWKLEDTTRAIMINIMIFQSIFVVFAVLVMTVSALFKMKKNSPEDYTETRGVIFLTICACIITLTCLGLYNVVYKNSEIEIDQKKEVEE